LTTNTELTKFDIVNKEAGHLLYFVSRVLMGYKKS